MRQIAHVSSAQVRSVRVVKSLAVRLRDQDSGASAQPLPTKMSQIVPECPVFSENDSAPSGAEASKALNQHDLATIPPATLDVPSGQSETSALASKYTLDERQARALQLLVEGLSDSQVAASVNVDRRTIYRWRRRGEFRRQMELLRDDLETAAKDRMHLLLPAAFEVIQHQLTKPNQPEALRAAAFIVRNALAKPPAKKSKSGESTHLPLTALMSAQ